MASSSAIMPKPASATPFSSIMARLPASTSTPWSVPATPRPWTARKPSMGARGMRRSFASATMASARGCSEGFSSEAATQRSSSVVVPSLG